MKTRLGFVSNSSSCSFVCEICGDHEGGWDSQGIDEFGFFECENEHIICRHCAVNVDKDFELGYEVNERYCPCCTGSKFSDSDVLSYTLKALGRTRDEIEQEMSAKHKGHTTTNKILGD